MKKGGILIMIVLLVCFAYFSAGECEPYDGFNHDSCTPSVCGIPPDYDYMYCVGEDYFIDIVEVHVGAAEICDVCYVCGVNDGVCPEDFEDAITGAKGDCSGCNDPDCEARITGYVYALGDGVPPFQPLQNAVVRAVPANPTLPELYSEPTDYYGYYEINFVPAGSFDVAASLVGYDTEIKNITVSVREVGEVNFTLPNGTCTQECTNSFGRCADCEGIKGCHYFDETVEALCMNRKLGDIIPYGIPDSSDYVTNVVCCNGNVTMSEYRPLAKQAGCMDNLVTLQLPANLDGQPVIVNIAVWPSGEC